MAIGNLISKNYINKFYLIAKAIPQVPNQTGGDSKV